jgi:cytoskeletal protein CcmA (bactofilin family)
MSEFRPQVRNVVYIGEGVSLTGTVQAKGIVVLDGNVNGEISCSRLAVGPTGAVTGAISVADADVYGSASVDIAVDRLLILRSSGRVAGKLVYGEIQIDKGGVLSGSAEPTPTGEGGNKTPSRRPIEKPEEIAPIDETESPPQDSERIASLTSRALRRRKRA